MESINIFILFWDEDILKFEFNSQIIRIVQNFNLGHYLFSIISILLLFYRNCIISFLKYS